ncbi:hypothetical protein AQUCO_01500045v1 [Aquilegia coerulea]|uniref:Uncharacterized protein n=1 Tax=Aquilegia coerulea TaxID=218851 RepID=A0A2G5DRW3_AQUCA|nr:hypothetical protein AQUCO_01500045v1 [Aquilegia coerulea]
MCDLFEEKRKPWRLCKITICGCQILSFLLRAEEAPILQTERDVIKPSARMTWILVDSHFALLLTFPVQIGFISWFFFVRVCGGMCVPFFSLTLGTTSHIYAGTISLWNYNHNGSALLLISSPVRRVFSFWNYSNGPYL